MITTPTLFIKRSDTQRGAKHVCFPLKRRQWLVQGKDLVRFKSPFSMVKLAPLYNKFWNFSNKMIQFYFPKAAPVTYPGEETLVAAIGGASGGFVVIIIIIIAITIVMRRYLRDHLKCFRICGYNIFQYCTLFCQSLIKFIEHIQIDQLSLMLWWHFLLRPFLTYFRLSNFR